MTINRPVLLACCVLAILPAAGCGGDSADEQALRAQEIEQARKEGAERERLKAKQREQEREQARLRKELRELKGKGAVAGASSSSQGATQNASTGSGALSQGTSCGDGLSVGPNTTCAFARNVRAEYADSGGSSVIEVYSPVTKQTYTMSCSGSSVTTCTGGNNATVYFR